MKVRKGVSWRETSRPRRKFGVPIAVVVIITALLALAASAPAGTISAGAYSSIGLVSDGTVAQWGMYNTVPEGLSGVVAVSANHSHNLALKADGTVVAWSDNGSPYPVPEGLSAVVAVAAGWYHNLALRKADLADGSNVICWGGTNYYGECTPPDTLSKFLAVAAGAKHSLALKADGTVVAWGDNIYGQTTVPENLTNPATANVVALAAGMYHSLALKADGTVVTWGTTEYGQTTVPENLTNPATANVVAVAAGRNHSLALKADGSVVAWGWNGTGQCDVPTALTTANTPKVVALAAGDYHSLALKADGSVVAWPNPNSVPAATTFALAPVAQIDPQEAVAPGTLVTLSGGNSFDYDNNIPLSYHWELTNWPPGSDPSLPMIKADWGWSASFEFTPDLPGDYRVMLLVKDSMGIIGPPVWRTVNVNTNTPPVADAGPDKLVTVIGDTVQLDGSQSYDLDGNPMTYQWSWVSWPGSTNDPQTTPPALTGETTVTPSFVAEVHGDYSLQLVVNDGQVDSSPDCVTVSFTNVKPVANAGSYPAKVFTDPLILDGSGSTDANGDQLTYQWSLVSGPEGSTATLNALTPQATFIADLPGTYVISLVVNDGYVSSDPNNTTVTFLTKQDAASDNLTGTVEVVASFTPAQAAEVFVNTNMQNALTNKINEALKLIDQKKYSQALNKLQNDILPKTNGCHDSGAPDANDWIKDCATQQQVYPFVVQTIDLLQGLQ